MGNFLTMVKNACKKVVNFIAKQGRDLVQAGVVGTVATVGVANAASIVDYTSIVTLAMVEVTAAIAAGVVFFGTVKGVKAGFAFISYLVKGR